MSRILIVEDDETLRGELSYFLIGNGYEVSVITDFKDTLDEMLKTDTELILLDLNLPGIDGQTLLRMYRKEKIPRSSLLQAKIRKWMSLYA